MWSKIGEVGLSTVRTGEEQLLLAATDLANVGTEGYRRRLGGPRDLPELVPGAGAGVRFEWRGVARDPRLVHAYLDARSVASADEEAAAALDRLAAIAAPVEGGVADRVAALRSAWSAATTLPDEPAYRRNATEAAADLATEIRRTANEMDQEAEGRRQVLDLAVRNLQERLRALAELEREHQPLRERAAEVAAERDRILAEIAQQVGIRVQERADGGVTVRTRSGALLYEKGQVAEIVRTGDGVEVVHGAARTRVTESDGGVIGGTVAWFTTYREARNELDRFAERLAVVVNAAHANGTTPNGTPGGVVFEIPTGATSAAAAIRVSASLASDPDAWAFARAGSLSGNLLDLEAALDDAWGTVWQPATEAVAFAAQGAASRAEQSELRLVEADRRLTNYSGVSLAEATQRAKEAELQVQAGVRLLEIADLLMAHMLSIGRYG